MDQRTSLAGAAVERSVVALAPPSCLEPRRLSFRRSMFIRPPDQPIVARTFGVLALVAHRVHDGLTHQPHRAAPFVVRALRRRVSRSVRPPPSVDRRRQRHPRARRRARGLLAAGRSPPRSTWLRAHPAPARRVRPRAADARRARRPADPAGHRRRLAARSRHRPHLDAQPDDLRVGDLRRRPQPDDDGVVAGGGAGEAGGRQAARRCRRCSRRRARTSGTPPRVFVERAAS